MQIHTQKKTYQWKTNTNKQNKTKKKSKLARGTHKRKRSAFQGISIKSQLKIKCNPSCNFHSKYI